MGPRHSLDRCIFVSIVPAAERNNLEEIRTDTKLFNAMVEALRKRGGAAYKMPAGHIELCNVPITVRTAGANLTH